MGVWPSNVRTVNDVKKKNTNSAIGKIDWDSKITCSWRRGNPTLLSQPFFLIYLLLIHMLRLCLDSCRWADRRSVSCRKLLSSSLVLSPPVSPWHLQQQHGPQQNPGLYQLPTRVTPLSFLLNVIQWSKSNYVRKVEGSSWSKSSLFSILVSFYCLGFNNTAPSGLCLAGFFCTGGSDSPTQHEAQEGHYTWEGAAGAQQCPLGTYQPVGSAKIKLSDDEKLKGRYTLGTRRRT